MTFQILIADDHTVVREGLATIINAETEMEVIGEAGDADEAVSLAVEKKPDLVVMDISMPDGGGIEATRRIKRTVPEVGVLILTVHEDKELMQEAIAAGAGGYVLKKAIKSQLVHAVETVLRGELYLHPLMAGKLLKASQQERTGGREHLESAGKQTPEHLTPREIEVIRLIAQGYTNRQAAEELDLSMRTVEYHRGNLMAKLGLQGRVELVRYVEEHRLL